ncbi:hypothetical protein Plhal304r1_c045g0125741 [Plasmopara halstedii]
MRVKALLRRSEQHQTNWIQKHGVMRSSKVVASLARADGQAGIQFGSPLMCSMSS